MSTYFNGYILHSVTKFRRSSYYMNCSIKNLVSITFISVLFMEFVIDSCRELGNNSALQHGVPEYMLCFRDFFYLKFDLHRIRSFLEQNPLYTNPCVRQRLSPNKIHSRMSNICWGKRNKESLRSYQYLWSLHLNKRKS